MKLFSGVCAAALACVLAAPAMAADFEVPIDLPTGSVIHLDLVKDGEQERNGQSMKLSMKFVYRQDIVATDEGYTISQTLVESQLPPEAREVAGLMTAVSKIKFDAGEDLSPVRIRDQAGLVKTIVDSVVKLAGAEAPDAQRDALKAQMNQLYGSLSPEAAASAFLKEQTLLSAPQMLSLDLGKPLGGEMEVPNPLGGAQPILRTQVYELKSVDKAAGRAVIEMRDELDSESLKAMIGPMLAQLAPTAPKLTEAEIAAIKIEQKTACRWEMDLKTGLTAKADCTITRSAVDDDGKPNRRVEHIVMTQRLERP